MFSKIDYIIKMLLVFVVNYKPLRIFVKGLNFTIGLL